MANKKTIKILGIETSCDETAAAVLSVDLRRQNLPVFSPQDSSFSEKLFSAPSKSVAENTTNSNWPKITTLSSVVKSQIKLHSKFGGVVPDVAARAHVKNIQPVVKRALSTSHLALSSMDYIAVTQGPGLIPSLIVGVEFAKALSFATKIPLLPVNHMAGHLYSPFKDLQLTTYNLKTVFPMVALIVSGGHTMLVLMKDIKNYRVLGQTVDDAAGEAFDKVAKLLKLPYPGGPQISKLAIKGKPSFVFPRPMINSNNYDFSFSGLKTAVLYKVQSLSPNPLALSPQQKADICKAFQDAAVDVLVTKTMRAAKEFKAKSVSVSGGVAANQALREKLIVNCKLLKVKFFVPPKNLCTDNAEMIAIAAAFALNNKQKPTSYQRIKADPNLEL